MKRSEKVRGLLQQLCAGLYEREEVVKLALLAAVAGESIFLLGPPGVGKSLVARRLKYAFTEAESFEYLMTRFSTPDEVFGPVSIQKLKEEDKYERQTERYMPGAHIVFLDEIWKASSAIQNALLTIINEKLYRNGEQERPVNLRALVTASNELPPGDENFGPLYDRLLVRYQVEGLRDQQRFVQMITETEALDADPVSPEYKIGAEEWAQWQAAIDKVKIEDEVLSVIQIVRQKLSDYNENQEDATRQIRVYDRRWKKLVRLLRASAFLNERERVDLMDCFLMIHCLWNQPEQQALIAEMVRESIAKHGYRFSLGLGPLEREIESFREEVEGEVKLRHLVSEEVLRPVEEEYYALRKNGEDFAGRYLKVSDFHKLPLDSAEVLNLYDEDYKLVNRLKAQKGERQFSLRLQHNAQQHDMSLETYQKERAQYLYKKPHPLVEQFWEERYAKLARFIEEKQAHLEGQLPAALRRGQAHLLVDASLFPVVETHHRELQERLAALSMQLDKLRHLYQNADN